MKEDPSMLQYWIYKKGIDAAFAEYYPLLSETDRQLRDALQLRRVATKALEARVAELVADAPEDEW